MKSVPSATCAVVSDLLLFACGPAFVAVLAASVRVPA